MMRENLDINKFPLIEKMKLKKHVLWMNEKLKQTSQVDNEIKMEEIIDAENRLIRFASYIKEVFPLTKFSDGMIESDLKEIPAMKKLIEGRRGIEIPGTLYLKCDHALPISGSIKARGGIYEVLNFAEHLAIKHKLINVEEDYTKFHSKPFRELFQNYQIAVGSTGNLGLSIGIISAQLGFNVTVHMSAEAKQWKKDLLIERGVHVIEHEADYTEAVAQGRQLAAQDENCHFVDDENSKELFLGYAVAALRLQKQLEEKHILVDEEHPLFVYLPCGVGGGPGGVAYGLKQIYGEHVHIFFGEPIQSPCMLLGMMTGLHDKIAVTDIGLTNETEADGLAVARPSKFVGKMMETILSGCYTVDDSFLFRSLKAMYEQENIFMEPSAHAAVYGPIALLAEGENYIKSNNLEHVMDNAIHLVWSTGGDMVPTQLRQQYLLKEL